VVLRPPKLNDVKMRPIFLLGRGVEGVDVGRVDGSAVRERAALGGCAITGEPPKPYDVWRFARAAE
jgi:hypothetical protein